MNAINAVQLNSVTQQRFTANGTFTPSATCKFVIVEVIGAGGGSGGTVATSAAQVSATGGGGNGGYCRAVFSRAALLPNVSVVVGAGGTAGAAASAGGSGGTSSFLTASAGGGGGTAAGVASSSTNPAGGSSGIATGGNFSVNGCPGLGSGAVITSSISVLQAARRGFGFGRQIGGAGGENTVQGPSVSATAGQLGTAGLVIVTSFNG